jgi:hypothetical protein
MEMAVLSCRILARARSGSEGMKMEDLNENGVGSCFVAILKFVR